MNRAANNLERGMVLSKALIIAAVLLVVVGLGWFLFGQNRGTSDPTARQATDSFVRMLAAKDASGSYEMLSDQIKEQTSQESWQAWLDFAFKNIDGQPDFVEELAVHEPTATYGEGATVARFVYSFKVENTTYEAPFVIVKKDGVWKIAEVGAFQE